MRRDRLIGALALTGALAGGGIAGAVFGVPGISGAQTATTAATPPTSTPTTAPAAPDRGADNDRGDCRFGPGTGFSSDAAAKALGISESELHDQLRAGKTIADVAKAKGVDVQKVIDAMVADATERIDRAVTEGHLTADRAASLKEGLVEHITTLVNEGARFKGGPDAGGLPGRPSGFAPRAFGGQFD